MASQNMNGKQSNLLAQELTRLEKQANKSIADEKRIADIKTAMNDELLRKKLEQEKSIEDILHKSRVENLAKEGKVWEAMGESLGEKIKGTLSSVGDSIASGELTKGLTNQLDTIVNNYINAQEKLSAHLVGVDGGLSGIVGGLNSALATTNLVKQESVYNNLSKLVNSGIVYNVEQRAFLQTLSDDLGMIFDAENGTLTQLIRLQGQDLSANRMAIEYSLQEFLNQNYNTSEYIQKAFTSVSDSLLDMQSLVSSSEAVALETDIQAWLGSYYSSGMNSSTVTSLAEAINDLGSGDISNLGNGISNLILMGAARAGLDYGSLLTNGVNTSDLNYLMSGITGYLQEIGGYESNVVKSQLANLFGVGISDIVAANNVSGVGASSDIYSTLFSDMSSLVPWQKWIGNSLSNAMFTWGTSVASDSGQYIGYQIEKLLAGSGIGGSLQDIGTSLGGLKGLPLTLAGIAINNAPLLSLFTSGAFTDIMGSLSSTFSSGGIGSIFNSLGGANGIGSSIKMSGAGVSGSMYVSSGGTEDLINGSNSSLSGFTDTLNIEGEDTEDPVDLIQSDVAEILSILDLYMSGIADNISSISETVSQSNFGQLGN